MKRHLAKRRAPVPVTIRRLMYLDALARECDIQQAADLCATPVATIREAISDLEIEFGVSLVDFGETSHSLTVEGRLLAARTRSLLAELAQTREAIEAIRRDKLSTAAV